MENTQEEAYESPHNAYSNVMLRHAKQATCFCKHLRTITGCFLIASAIPSAASSVVVVIVVCRRRRSPQRPQANSDKTTLSRRRPSPRSHGGSTKVLFKIEEKSSTPPPLPPSTLHPSTPPPLHPPPLHPTSTPPPRTPAPPGHLFQAGLVPGHPSTLHPSTPSTQQGGSASPPVWVECYCIFCLESGFGGRLCEWKVRVCPPKTQARVASAFGVGV